jgi:hypothetical protein
MKSGKRKAESENIVALRAGVFISAFRFPLSAFCR